MQAQVLSNMKSVDEDFISKRIRRSLSQPQEGKYEFQSSLLRVIQYKMKLSSLEVYHTNICHHVFHA